MENFLTLAQTEVSAAVVVFNLLLSLVLALIIAYVYQKTHRGLSYSPSFMGTLVVICLLGTVVMMVVAQNLIGAFALLGAFSLIRFRTILKETRDIAFVFFALVTGIGSGTNNYTITIISTFFIVGVILFLQRIRFGSTVKGDHLMTIVSNPSFSPDEKSGWKEYIKDYRILHSRTLSQDRQEYTIDIALKDAQTSESFRRAVQQTPGVLEVELVSGNNAVEY